jgi:prophage endopeptidase
VIPNPWVILAVVLAWAGSLAAVGTWQRHDGAAATKAAYEARDNAALKAANDKLQRLQAEKDQYEHAQAAALVLIDTKHQEELADAEKRRAADVAAARAGAIRLRDPGVSVPSHCDAVPDAQPPAGERDATETAGLSREATEFLLGFANDADAVVAQLSSCQAVVRTYLNPKGAAP